MPSCTSRDHCDVIYIRAVSEAISNLLSEQPSSRHTAASLLNQTHFKHWPFTDTTTGGSGTDAAQIPATTAADVKVETSSAADAVVEQEAAQQQVAADVTSDAVAATGLPNVYKYCVRTCVICC